MHRAERTDQRSVWWWARWAYRAALVALFAAIVWRMPERILFGPAGRPSPADFVPYVRDRCVPVVLAVLAYQRDHGPLYNATALAPAYLPAYPDDPEVIDGHTPNRIVLDSGFYHERITCDVDVPGWAWDIRGAFVNGPIPVPPVNTTAPTTRRP